MKDREQIKKKIESVLVKYRYGTQERINNSADEILDLMDKQDIVDSGKGWEVYEYATKGAKSIWALNEVGMYRLGKFEWNSANFDDPTYHIHAVRIDTVVYRIGDTIVDSNDRPENAFKITKFTTDNSGCIYAEGDRKYTNTRYDYWKKVPNIVKIEMLAEEYRMYREWKDGGHGDAKSVKVLLTTEDGVGIADPEQKLWDTSDQNWTYLSQTAAKSFIEWKGEEYLKHRKCWYSKDKAEEYILMNKPIYSINDVGDKITGKSGAIFNRLIREQKEKLTTNNK